MKKLCMLMVSGALVASSCGSSGSEGVAPPSAGSAPVTEAAATSEAPPATEPPASDTAPTATEPPGTEPPGTDPAVVSEPVSITSTDGDLTVTLPGDVAADLGVSVRLLEPSELPPEVADADNLDSVKVYELEPDGARFDEPVTITRRLDVAAFEFLQLGPNDVPFVTLLNRDASGTYELLDDLTMTRLGDDLYLSGSTSHFSGFIASNEGTAIRDSGPTTAAGIATVRLDQQDATRELFGGFLTREVGNDGPGYQLQNFITRYLKIIQIEPDLDLDPSVSTAVAAALIFTDSFEPVESPEVAVESTSLDEGGEIVAIRQISTFDVPMVNAPSTFALLEGNPDRPASIEYGVRSLAAALPPSYLPEPYLPGQRPVISVDSKHTALDTYASFLRALFRGLGPLPPGARLWLGLREAGAFDGDSRIVDVRPLDVFADAVTTMDLGIECYCEYEFVLFFLEIADELAEEALAEATTLEEVLAILGAQENIGRLMLADSPDEPFVAGVTANEEPLAQDVAVIVELFGS